MHPDRPQPPTVFVIDADEASGNAVRAQAETLGLHCKTFDSARGFLQEYDPGQPGCLVTELRNRDIGGLELQRYLRQREMTLPVIILTAHPELSIAVEAMREGAVHFLEKPFSKVELLKAIHEAVELDQRRREDAAQHRQIGELVSRLTPKERRVLALLGRGHANPEIAQALTVSVRTIEAYRNRLTRKLDVNSVGELLELAMLIEDSASRDAESAGKWDEAQLASRGDGRTAPAGGPHERRKQRRRRSSRAGRNGGSASGGFEVAPRL